uniref:Focadhesin n=1 Tax=Sphaeramia orbicularis TaxID=375764 RepID=A0A673ASU0_9TELE
MESCSVCNQMKKFLQWICCCLVFQTVRSLLAAVLKEKGQNGQINQASMQGPALETLWQQCSGDCALVRSVCCDALVLLVDQGHADLNFILNSVLNLLPSARNVQGLLKVIGQLLQMQADQRDREKAFTCPYSIRSSPHPYITALENRSDCWPALIQVITDPFVCLCCRNEPAYITMLFPFLRFLYCEPQRQTQNALLRHSLLRVLLPVRSQTEKHQDKTSSVFDSLLRCLCQLVPHILYFSVHCSFLLLFIETNHCQINQYLLILFFDCSLFTQSGPALSLPLTSWYSELSVALSTLRKVANDPGAASDWLLSVSSCLSSSQRLPSSLTLIVTHLLITGREDVCHLALNAIQTIAAADPCQVPSLVPVLLFKLGKAQNPVLAHAVLSCLPNLGTHKLCVPTVLQTLHVLASAPKLRAVAMRLMTALWKKQDRVYPELQRLLGQQDSRVVVGRDAQWEQILARAACLRDICRERPYQHGGDMLAAITLTLNQCSKPDLATPAALALQGLQELCRAEVVDIVSTWRSLGPELSCDSRPLMVKATAELLALVPQLTVKSEAYEARPVVKLHETEDEDERKEKQEEEDLSVPGSSYVKLMALTHTSVLPAFQVFLTSLVKQEMSQMPRGVYFSALRQGGLRSDQGKTVAGIPAFMLKTYEKNKQPGLKPGLAGAPLPVQTDRNGKPIDRFLVSRSRSYQQTLTALVHEVNIQPSEWHRALLLPQAWRGFMSRAFHAVLQGRRADLEMQQKQGKESPEELQYKQHCAWLWARDQLTDVIKAATKDSPVVQGNSILALSGLAAVLAKYESNLPSDNDGSLGAGPEFVPTASWLAMVLDTLLSIISSSYRAKGQVFPWFLHRSYSGENTASAIARSCASLALSLLVPVLVVWQRDGVAQVLAALQAGLPGSPTADDTQAVQFHSGLALGMVMSSLHHQRLSDVSVQKDMDLLVTALNALESCSFNPDLEYNTGCILGLGLVLAALCSSGQMDQRVHVTVILDKLLAQLQESSGQGRMIQEVLAYSVSCVGVSAFSGGLIDVAKADEIMNTVRTLTEESQQTPGFSLALGLVVHGLSTCGHGKAEDIHPRLLAAWIKILLAEGCPTMQRLAAINGLVALVGSEKDNISCAQMISMTEHMMEVVCSLGSSCLVQIITFSGAIGLQSNSACLVGHLHLAHMSTSHSHTAVPQDFSYLSERSVIRSIIDFITEAGKKGPEFSHSDLVKTALTPLASVGSSFQYPPINWSAVLSPLMRLSFGEDVQHQCMVLAASQAQSSQSAALFLGSWLSPPLVHSLSVTAGKTYLLPLGLQQFQDDLRPQRLSLCRSILQGLAQAMALPNPPNNCWTILCSTTEKIFNLLPNQVQVKPLHMELYVGTSKCLSEMSDTEIDRISRVTETQMEKSCFILAFLTSQGRVPLLGLNDVIAGVLRGWPSRRIGWFVSFVSGVSKRLEWLLELMGHVRNVAYGASAVTCGEAKLVRDCATDFLFQVFAAAVISWGEHFMPLLFGIRAQWFPWQLDSKPPAVQHALYGEELLTEHALPQCLLGLSHSLSLLLEKEPWSSQSHKVSVSDPRLGLCDVQTEYPVLVQITILHILSL